ncbi:class F sortase [Streptomyces sp. NPDC046985]|uniref:class F sortase n=1 Tax=Streptomyces sp. NPDC046985 TaxID=3155377 RepID=UPI0033F4C086
MTDNERPEPTGAVQHRRPWRIVLAGAALALLVAGGLLLAVGLGEQQPAPPRLAAPSSTSVSEPPTPAASAAASPAVLPASVPVRLTIPAIGVSTSLEHLGLGTGQVLQPPKDPGKAGWFRLGPTPGARGPAVLAGHVTWNQRKAVFFRLAELKPGQGIEVSRQDGRTARFTVTKVAQYVKTDFPSIDVYRNLDYAGLRLITCGGAYSTAHHRYSDNVVVYARLSS